MMDKNNIKRYETKHHFWPKNYFWEFEVPYKDV